MRVDPELSGSERELLGQYLDYQRETVLLKAEGLSGEQLARTHPPPELTLGGLLYHLALVEESWMEVRFLGRPARVPWVGVDWDADPNWEFHTAADLPPEDLLQRYRDACDRSRQVVLRPRASTIFRRSRWPTVATFPSVGSYCTSLRRPPAMPATRISFVRLSTEPSANNCALRRTLERVGHLDVDHSRLLHPECDGMARETSGPLSADPNSRRCADAYPPPAGRAGGSSPRCRRGPTSHDREGPRRTAPHRPDGPLTR